ncbi:MAG: hypothetical protein U0790_17380 [Isosphaeraceae bacterium]
MNRGMERSTGSDEGESRYQRALAALKATAVPEGPSEDLVARSLAAMETSATPRSNTTRHWRRIVFTASKYAAVFLAAAAGWFLAANPLLRGAPVSFEEVAAKLRQAHTLAYTMTTRHGDDTPAQSVRLFFKEPGRLRCESVPAGGAVVVSDTVAARKLVLDPAAKTALLFTGNLPGEVRPGQPDIAAAAVADLRQLGQKKGQPIGEKTLGTVKAVGFRVQEGGGYERVVWADPQTHLPIQVDFSGPFGDKTIRSTIDNIQLDPELEDALFSLESPAGYTLQKQELAGADDKDDGTPEAAIRILLRSYAEGASGAFPKRIDDWQALAQSLKGKPGEAVQATAMRTANLVARMAALLFVAKDAYGYRPDGVKLGDADKVVFWYRLPGKPNYRAVHGDLTIKDATEDQVPAPLKPAPKP